MRHLHLGKLGRMFAVPLLLVLAMSLNGQWGVVYGQSTGPAVPPEGTAVGGAEGDPIAPPDAPVPIRQTVVAGVSGEASEDPTGDEQVPAQSNQDRPHAVAGESGETGRLASILGISGAGSVTTWPLLAGLVLVVAGCIMLVRARRTR